MDAKSHLEMISNTKENVKSRNNDQKKIVRQSNDARGFVVNCS